MNQKVEHFIVNDLTGKKLPRRKNIHSFESKFSEALAVDNMQLKYVAPSKFYNMTPIEEKLRKYIKGEGIKLMVSKVMDSELFVTCHSGYVAIILQEQDIYETSNFRICSIAHELGHYFDFKHNFDFDSDTFAMYSEEFVDLLETETIAWAYAKDILTVLGYKNWDYFNQIALESLTSYAEDDEELAQEYLKQADVLKLARKTFRMHC